MKDLGVVSGDLHFDISKVNEIRNLFAHELDIYTNEVRTKFKEKVFELKVLKELTLDSSLTTSQVLTGAAVALILKLWKLYRE